ncbi:MAG: hypothetical protein ACRCZ9_02395 [Fusobacteriaceae bacterium]
MVNIFNLFVNEFGMTERSAKTMITRLRKDTEIQFGLEVDDDNLRILLSHMKTGKYKDNANRKLFDMSTKDYTVSISKRPKFEKGEDPIKHNFKIFDSVFIDSNKNRGMIVEKVQGNHASVEITTGSLSGQTVKIKTSELKHRIRGER